jgi:hypothetical protein
MAVILLFAARNRFSALSLRRDLNKSTMNIPSVCRIAIPILSGLHHQDAEEASFQHHRKAS